MSDATAEPSGTNAEVSQSGVAMAGRMSAWMRKRAACAAMPAASSRTSAEVAEKNHLSGMRRSPA